MSLNNGGRGFLDRLLLTLVFLAFLITFAQYYVSVSFITYVPVICIYIASVLTLLGAKRRRNVTHLLNGGKTLILFSLLSETVSHYTGDRISEQYGLALILLMISWRLLISEIGFLAILRCYAVSSMCSLSIVAFRGRAELASYREGAARFSGGAQVHPNLVGFAFAGALPLFIGIALDHPPGTRRKICIGMTALACYVIFTTGSRGSVGAILITGCILGLRFVLQGHSLLRVKVSYGLFLGILLVLLLGTYTASNVRTLQSITHFFDVAFSVTNKQRGIGSGMSGRTILWRHALHRIHGLNWIFGMGYRQGFDIDNGYVTLLFDSGILGGLVIAGTLIRILVWLWSNADRTSSYGVRRYRLVLLSMMLIYLLNNISTRYLFSFGNQFSLLVLVMMVCRKEDLLLAPRVA